MNRKIKGGYLNFRQTREYGVPSGFTPPFFDPAAFHPGSAGAENNTNIVQAPLNFSQPTPGVTSNGETIQTVDEITRFGDPTHVPFTVGTTAQIILPASNTRRVFFMILNTHASGTLYVQFGAEAATVSAIPLPEQNSSLFFDAFVPQNDVWVLGSAVGITGVLIYAAKTV